jgi:hypothetical protein
MTSTAKLEEKIKAFMSSMLWMQPEASDLSKLYWAEVNTDTTYTALAAGAAATFSTKLTKQEVINALTYIEQLDKFYTNQALSQADYLLNVQGIINGNDQYVSPGISVAIENFGERAVSLCSSALQLFKDGKDILDVYFDTEISAAIGAVTGEECPWYTFSKSDFSEAVSLVEAFKKLINNEVAAQADYGATVAKWRKIL